VIGAINWDVSVFEDRFARSGEEVPVRLVEECSGGKGANVAVAAARLLGRGRAAFLGALGDDELCDRQLAELDREGVLTGGVSKVKGCQSGRAYIIVDAGGRKTIHTHFGANDRVSAADLRKGDTPALVARTAIMIIMDPPTPAAMAAAQEARRHGAKVIYSPGVRTQEGLPAVEGVMEQSDYLVVDRMELMNLYHKRGEKEAQAAVTEAHPRLAVVTTLGDRGCVVARGGTSTTVGGVDLLSLGKKPVNTTGCGDAFLGAFASYILMGHRPLDAANWANLAGALKAERYETRGSPRRDELESAMRGLEQVRRAQLGLPGSRAS
jgi:ribokinase